MKSTIFYKKDGSISSIRNTTGEKKNKVSLTHYVGTNRGGVTFKSSGFSSRFNNKGQSIGHSMKTGNTTLYTNSFGRPVSRMNSF